MASPPPYTFSRPADVHTDPLFDHAVRFAVDKRDAALMPVLRTAPPGVVTVADESEDNWQTVRDQVAAGLFGYLPGTHQAYVRDALRPASRGAGRGRFR
jgi:hypothetical protein